MKPVSALLEQLDDLGRLNDIRWALVAFIHALIEEDAYRVNVDSKVHLVNAIGSLALNVNSIVQPTNAWLRLCIVDLMKASGQRQYRHQQEHNEIDKVSKQDLLAALISITLKLPAQTKNLGQKNALYAFAGMEERYATPFKSGHDNNAADRSGRSDCDLRT